MKTLHICTIDKFIPPFIDLVREHFPLGEQFFFIIGKKREFSYKVGRDTCNPSFLIRYVVLAYLMNKSKKIVLHGLFDIRVVILLFFQPWLLKRCYWIIWGGDLFRYKNSDKNLLWKINEFFRRRVIRDIGNLVTYTKGDVELTRKWYGAAGKHIACFNYPSNTFKDIKANNIHNDVMQIQVGNSGDPSNNHFRMFELLIVNKQSPYQVFCPLAYGDKAYCQDVIERGELLFSDGFHTIKELMPFDTYIERLSCIDIAIFGHKRQQAFGNIITLLGLGKTVFIDEESTLFPLLIEMGITIHSIKDFRLEVQSKEVTSKNIKIIKDKFSEDSLVKSLKEWL